MKNLMPKYKHKVVDYPVKNLMPKYKNLIIYSIYIQLIHTSLQQVELFWMQ